MADRYKSFAGTPSSYGTKGRVITPGADDIDPPAKAVVLLTSGNVTVVPMDNEDAAALAFVGVPAGFSPPFRVRRVTAATATVATVEDY